MTPRLQVMQFGGTSVGDADCIARTAQIVAKAAKENPCIAVVSAMSGVTNRLIEAARKAQAGDTRGGSAFFDAVGHQHQTPLASLGPPAGPRAASRVRLEKAPRDGQPLCRRTVFV